MVIFVNLTNVFSFLQVIFSAIGLFRCAKCRFCLLRDKDAGAGTALVEWPILSSTYVLLGFVGERPCRGAKFRQQVYIIGICWLILAGVFFIQHRVLFL